MNKKIGLFAGVSFAVVLTVGATVERVPLREGWKFFRATLSTDEHDFTFDRMSAWLDGKDAPARMPGRKHRFVATDCDEKDWRELCGDKTPPSARK